MDPSTTIALASLIVSIIGVTASFFYTRKTFEGKKFIDDSVKEIQNAVQSINHWTSDYFFHYNELDISTIVKSIQFKFEPYFLELYSRDRINPAKDTMHFKFTPESKVNDFITAFKWGEPINTYLYLKGELSNIIPKKIVIKSIWSLGELEMNLSKLLKFRSLIDPLDPEIIDNLFGAIYNTVGAFFSSLQNGLTEFIIDNSLSSENIYNELYQNIFDYAYIDYNLSWLRGGFTERLIGIQKALFMKK